MNRFTITISLADGNPLLHQEELPVAFHDSGDGEVRAQGHDGSITIPVKSFVMFIKILEDHCDAGWFLFRDSNHTFLASCSA